MEDLEAIAALEPEHISFYSLQLEEGTSFFRDFEAGKLREVPDETDRKMYHRGIQVLREKGYRHYEISNFARSGRYALHNTSYWKGVPYLGLGAAAHSYDGKSRRINPSSLSEPLNLSVSGIPAQSGEFQKPERLGIDEETSDEYTADYTLAAQNDNLLFYAWYQDKSVDLFEIPVPDQLEQELVIKLDESAYERKYCCWQTAAITPISFRLDGRYGYEAGQRRIYV